MPVWQSLLQLARIVNQSEFWNIIAALHQVSVFPEMCEWILHLYSSFVGKSGKHQPHICLSNCKAACTLHELCLYTQLYRKDFAIGEDNQCN